MDRKGLFRALAAMAGWYLLQPAVSLAVVTAATVYFNYFGPGAALSGAALEAHFSQWLGQAGNLLMIGIDAFILLVVALAAARRAVGFGRYTGLAEPLGGAATGALCLLAGVSANFWFSLVLNSGMISQEALARYGEAYAAVQGGALAFELLALVVLAPLVEEILFRGLILGCLRRIVPIGAAIVVQGMLFGFLHSQPLWIAYAIVLGVMIGYLRVRVNSLRAALLFHVAFNAASYLFGFAADALWHNRLTFSAALVASGALFFLAVFRLTGPRDGLVS